MSTKIKISTLLLSLSMFFTGASGLIDEYLLSTISIYILGNSIEQFSITIAIMLGMMGVGGWVQKFIKDDNLIEKFIIIEIFLVILGSFSPIGIYAAFGYLENNFTLVLYFLISAMGFLIGFEIPFIIRINEKYSQTLKSNLSIIISADYFGSFIGAIIWVKLLLPHFNIIQIGFFVSGTNFIVAIITFIYFYKIGLVKSKKIFIFLILTVLLLIFGLTNSKRWEIHLEQRLYKDKVVFSKTTRYQHLTITHNNILDEYRLYINGNTQFSSLDEVRYHEFLVHPAMALLKKHKQILILGGGDGLAVRELKKYKDIDNITLIDLDKDMTKLARENPILRKLNQDSFLDARVTNIDIDFKSKGVRPIYQEEDNNRFMKIADISIINVDADKYISKIAGKKYDLVIIDLPDPNSIELNKLYTKEFYMKLKRVLTDDSLIVMQATSPFHAKEAFLCIGRTLRGAGLKITPYHYNIPSFGDWGWYLISLNDNYKKRLKDIHFSVQTKFITPELFYASLAFGKEELITKDNSINSLMEPKLFYIYNNNSWLKY